MVEMTVQKYESLVCHDFIVDVLAKSEEIQKNIGAKENAKFEIEFSRDPYENEFYVLELEFSLIQLLTSIEQLEHAILYMENFSPTIKMKKKGINRANHLLWSIENFVIRVQTFIDRLLILIDRLFNIQNPTRLIKREILKNPHVIRTPMPSLINKIIEEIREYSKIRNEIVHESSVIEVGLRRIGRLNCLQQVRDDKDYKVMLKFLTKNYIKEKKSEFLVLNQKIFNLTFQIFSEMHVIFKKKYLDLNK